MGKDLLLKLECETLLQLAPEELVDQAGWHTSEQVKIPLGIHKEFLPSHLFPQGGSH